MKNKEFLKTQGNKYAFQKDDICIVYFNKYVGKKH